MKRNYFLSLLLSTVLTSVGLLAVQPSIASSDVVWLEGLVLTKAGKVARNADVVIRDADGNKITLYNSYGDEVTDIKTDQTGNFTLTYLPISEDAYSVVIKYSGDTYRHTMLIDEPGDFFHHRAELFRLALTESSAIELDDEYTYYRAGMRHTDSEGKVIYLETRTPETDYPYTQLYSYHLETGQVRPMDDLMERLGGVRRDALDFTIDGRHVAAAGDQVLKVWHVTKLERKLKRSLSGNEYFANSTSFGGAHDIEWLDNDCVRAAIYQADPEAEDYVERPFLEYRTYCL